MTRTAAVPLDRLHRFNDSSAPRLEHGQSVPDGIRGVRVTGYLSDESGWGAAGRGYACAVRQLRVPMRIHDLSVLTTNGSEDDTSCRPNRIVSHACPPKRPGYFRFWGLTNVFEIYLL